MDFIVVMYLGKIPQGYSIDTVLVVVILSSHSIQSVITHYSTLYTYVPNYTCIHAYIHTKLGVVPLATVAGYLLSLNQA